jgi:hypothetical protein
MSFYSLLRIAHSYWRWIVLLTTAVVIVRSILGSIKGSEWTHGDERAARHFVGAYDLQGLMGVILYTVSPFASAVFHSFRESMQSATSRFFGVEHQAAMLVAWIAVHLWRDRVKRAHGARKHQTVWVLFVIFLPLVLWAVPWPWRIFGRPLLRTTW